MNFDPSQIPHVFHARSVRGSRRHRTPSGFRELDEALLGGWPNAGVIEILIDDYGIGELHLLLPLLRSLTSAGPKPSLLLWLNAPYTPNGVAFAQHRLHTRHWLIEKLSESDVLWASEQALRSCACSTVLAWTSTSNMSALRRLKLAALSSMSVGLLFRPIASAQHPSPASLRIVLRPLGDRLLIEAIKNEGCKPCELAIDVRSGQEIRSARA